MSGSGATDLACCGCLPRLCVTRDASGRVTALSYRDDTGGLVAVPDCGSGSGGGGTVATECCPGRLLPSVLYVTVTGATGDCSCLDGVTFPLTWNGSAWVAGSSLVLCGLDQAIRLQCLFGGTSWTMDAQVPGCRFLKTADAGWSCDPLLLTFTGASVTDCCTGVIDLVVSETAP